ncbi:MAG TPA: GNAT family N-acetyltransferase [Longimicrobiales bacterium]
MNIRIRRHGSADAFLRRAESWLLEAEAEYTVPLGLAYRMRESLAGFVPPIYLATVERGGDVVGCAFRTPPFKLGLTRMPDEALPALVEDVAGVYAEIPAVLGPEREARRFAALWSERTGVVAREGMRERIYRLDAVQAPAQPPPGRLRVAEPEDLDLATEWIASFAAEAGIQTADAARMAEAQISRAALVLWEDEVPRSMAVEAARTPNGARIGFVYTPPQWRGRGYASACVAELSQRILDSGRRFCCLYTDLSNPTSNAIYQRIGYRAVCDVADYEFAAPEQEAR